VLAIRASLGCIAERIRVVVVVVVVVKPTLLDMERSSGKATSRKRKLGMLLL
jgi:hypothetical protein